MRNTQFLPYLLCFFSSDAIVFNGAAQQIMIAVKIYFHKSRAIFFIPYAMLDCIFNKGLYHHIRDRDLLIVLNIASVDFVREPVFESNSLQFKITGKEFYF